MRVRVELPINKPLRRSGYIAGADGQRLWINFKYERLSTFCFVCGKLGHDNKHCDAKPRGLSNVCQYGEWLKAGGSGKENMRRGWSKEGVH